MGARDRGGERDRAAGQSFAETHDVGHDAGLFTREHRSGAAEAGENFVGDQKHAWRSRHKSATRRKVSGAWNFIPPAPCTRGSIMTAVM